MDKKTCKHFYVFLEKETTCKEQSDGTKHVTTVTYLKVCQHCGDSATI